jgi:hypothetical protein
MDQYERFVEIVHRFKRDFKQSYWDANRIDCEYGRRTLRQIIASGEVPMSGCFEKEHVIGYGAKNEGIDVKLVMMNLWRPTYGNKLRMAIELSLDNQDYVFYPGRKKSILRKGKMPYKYIHLFFPKEIVRAEISTDLDMSWFNHFGINDLYSLPRIFSDISIDEFIKSVKEANTPISNNI